MIWPFGRRARLTSGEEWGVALGGPLTRWNDEPFGQLESASSKRQCREILTGSWGVDGTDGLTRICGWLVSGGHTEEALAVLDGYVPPRESCDDPDGRIRIAQRDASFLPTVGYAAFDLGRLAQVVRWGVTAGWMTREVGWGWIALAARQSQSLYSSWREFGEHWGYGLEYWSARPSEPGDPLSVALEWLIGDPESPWVRFSWSTSLHDLPDDAEV